MQMSENKTQVTDVNPALREGVLYPPGAVC